MVQVLNFPRKCVYLIGARCSGKSTVGALLAARLKWALAETDTLAEEILGRTIASVVSSDGWHAFRDAESEALRRAAGLEPAVVSTGGGIVLREENCELMNRTGLIVYLRASGEELAERLTRNLGPRPSLTGVHPAREIFQVLEEREPIYRKLAHLSVDVHRPAEEVCKHIYSILLMRGAGGNLSQPGTKGEEDLERGMLQ